MSRTYYIMPTIKIEVDDNEYAQKHAEKGTKTWREFIGLPAKTVGRPSLDQLKLEGDDYKARKLAEFKKTGHDIYMDKIREGNKQMQGEG